MADFLCLTGLIAFFGFLIYSIMTKPEKTTAAPPAPEPKPPSPVGLFCSLCGVPAMKVSAEEYARITSFGNHVYCEWCITSIEAYKEQQARR